MWIAVARRQLKAGAKSLNKAIICEKEWLFWLQSHQVWDWEQLQSQNFFVTHSSGLIDNKVINVTQLSSVGQGVVTFSEHLGLQGMVTHPEHIWFHNFWNIKVTQLSSVGQGMVTLPEHLNIFFHSYQNILVTKLCVEQGIVTLLEHLGYSYQVRQFSAIKVTFLLIF